jgi:hypothetical protein
MQCWPVAVIWSRWTCVANVEMRGQRRAVLGASLSRSAPRWMSVNLGQRSWASALRVSIRVDRERTSLRRQRVFALPIAVTRKE